MTWDKDKSILLSRGCVCGFAALLLALDAGAWWFSGWFAASRGMAGELAVALCVTIGLCSVFAWVILFKLWRLLDSLSRGEVFVERNVSHLRAVSWCCAAVAAVCLVSTAYYLPFLLVAGASAFMALIVRIVKNVFQQAIAMKNELDLTV